MSEPYHHGNLREAVLKRAVEVIETEGPHLFSLRSLSADLGVSHTAPLHHFGSKEGVLNALAAQGFRWLGERLSSTRESGEGFLEVGVAYVEFAITHPAHFQVMFTPSLLSEDDPELASAKRATFSELQIGVETVAQGGQIEDAAAAVIAAWSLVHGIATLALTGNLDGAAIRQLVADGDLLEITRRAAGMLYGSPGSDQKET